MKYLFLKDSQLKASKAIELEPKRMEYFIFSALVYFCWLFYYSYTDSQ